MQDEDDQVSSHTAPDNNATNTADRDWENVLHGRDHQGFEAIPMMPLLDRKSLSLPHPISHDIVFSPGTEELRAIRQVSTPKVIADGNRPDSILTNRDFHKMELSERSTAFKKSLAEIINAGAEATVLDRLFRSISSAEQDEKLPLLEVALLSVDQCNPADRPKLLMRLADEVKTLPPQNADFNEPTHEQVRALQTILNSAASLKPTVLREVLDGKKSANGLNEMDGLQAAIERACVGEVAWMYDWPDDGDAVGALNRAVENNSADTQLVNSLNGLKDTWRALQGRLNEDTTYTKAPRP